MRSAFLLLALCGTTVGHAQVVDASTLNGKVLFGYQGWFRCPGDPSGAGWLHWSRKAAKLTPDTVTFEMSGFAGVVKPAIRLSASQDMRLDANMALTERTEAVT